MKSIRQANEHLDARGVGIVGIGVVLAIAILSGVAWRLVVPIPSLQTLPPSLLAHDLYTPGADGTPVLDRDPAIDSAIDEVIADPSLIGGHR